MFLPQTYAVALSLMILSMLCWGSWANTLKLCPGYRFQLFYWDYAIGVVLGALAWGFTAGSFGSSGTPFWDAVMHTPGGAIAYAICGGIIFNIANLLLVAAIDVAGLAVAFPVGIGLALIVGTISSYFVHPAANPLLIFSGVALVTVAIILDAAAYRRRESAAKATTTRGIVLSLVAGLLMGTFYPLVAHAMATEVMLPGALAPFLPGPYAIALFFSLGVLLSTFPANWLLMKKPLDGKPPVDGADYGRASLGWHIAGILGGFIWCCGAVSNFVASQAHVTIGPAVSYSIGQGATMISACWASSSGASSPALPNPQRRCSSSCSSSSCSAWAPSPWPRYIESRMPKPIVVVGSINMDLVARTPRIPLAGETLIGTGFDTTPGGKGANQAVAVARLGYPVQMVGAVGEDVFGTNLLDTLKAAGVDTSAIARMPGPSGVAQIQVADNGQNSIVVVPGSNAKVDSAFIDQHQNLLRSAGMVLLQMEIPMTATLHTLELCAAARVPVMLDPAPAAQLPASAWPRIAWFTPNETEAPLYVSAALNVKDAAQALLARGLKGVVLKRGAEGAHVAASNGRAKWLPAFRVKAIDSVGAGDCFNGALAVALIEGQDPIVAAHFASAAAAISVTRRGAQASMPTRTEVDKFLSERGVI